MILRKYTSNKVVNRPILIDSRDPFKTHNLVKLISKIHGFFTDMVGYQTQKRPKQLKPKYLPSYFMIKKSNWKKSWNFFSKNLQKSMLFFRSMQFPYRVTHQAKFFLVFFYKCNFYFGPKYSWTIFVAAAKLHLHLLLHPVFWV
jgi:hypothetical protein